MAAECEGNPEYGCGQNELEPVPQGGCSMTVYAVTGAQTLTSAGPALALLALFAGLALRRRLVAWIRAV